MNADREDTAIGRIWLVVSGFAILSIAYLLSLLAEVYTGMMELVRRG